MAGIAAWSRNIRSGTFRAWKNVLIEQQNDSNRSIQIDDFFNFLKEMSQIL